MFHALNLPLFGALSDPSAILDVGGAAEESGFDGLFVWDHVLSPIDGRWDIADAWITLAGLAAVTRRIRLGPMVTPVTRRRLIKVAREVVTLDHLSGGRLILGLGLGGDAGRELSAFGEVTDDRTRAQGLDEAPQLLTRLWSGEEVESHGFFELGRVSILPGPIQQPRVPIWFAARGSAQRPARRAARYDGIFPIDVDRDQLITMLDTIRRERGHLDGFDVAVAARRGANLVDLERIGATWALHSFWPGHTPDQVLRFVARGRPG